MNIRADYRFCYFNINKLSFYVIFRKGYCTTDLLSLYILETYLNAETLPNDTRLELPVIICSVLITLPKIKEEVFVFITNRLFL